MMKAKLSLLFCLVVVYALAQVNTQDPPAKNTDWQVFVKPTSFDSTKTFEEQFGVKNKYQFLGAQLLLPIVTNPEAGPILFAAGSENPGKGNKNYTITGILEGNFPANLEQKKVTAQCGYRYKDLHSAVWKEEIVFVVFALKEDDPAAKDTLYWVVSQSKFAPFSNSYFNSFVAKPYLAKQQQLFLNQEVIDLGDKSKWICREVTYRKVKGASGHDTIYEVLCLLMNDKKEQKWMKSPSEKNGRSFITTKEYDWLDHANRNEKLEMVKEENDRRQKRLTDCTGRFGPKYGKLVAEEKIEPGMTREMCRWAWGAPWSLSKNTAHPDRETWYYSWKFKLYFRQDLLVNIEH